MTESRRQTRPTTTVRTTRVMAKRMWPMQTRTTLRMGTTMMRSLKLCNKATTMTTKTISEASATTSERDARARCSPLATEANERLFN